MYDNTVKFELLKLCQNTLDFRHNAIKQVIEDLQQSLESETKSSAGDKHETGRAMVQLEREKAGKQLAEIQKSQQVLSKINLHNNINTVGLGSVVYTSKFNYFIAISAGELIYNNTTFFAISPKTPIGNLLIGKSIQSQIKFRETSFIIKHII